MLLRHAFGKVVLTNILKIKIFRWTRLACTYAFVSAFVPCFNGCGWSCVWGCMCSFVLVKIMKSFFSFAVHWNLRDSASFSANTRDALYYSKEVPEMAMRIPIGTDCFGSFRSQIWLPLWSSPLGQVRPAWSNFPFQICQSAVRYPTFLGRFCCSFSPGQLKHPEVLASSLLQQPAIFACVYLLSRI